MRVELDFVRRAVVLHEHHEDVVFNLFVIVAHLVSRPVRDPNDGVSACMKFARDDVFLQLHPASHQLAGVVLVVEHVFYCLLGEERSECREEHVHSIGHQWCRFPNPADFGLSVLAAQIGGAAICIVSREVRQVRVDVAGGAVERLASTADALSCTDLR